MLSNRIFFGVPVFPVWLKVWWPRIKRGFLPGQYYRSNPERRGFTDLAPVYVVHDSNAAPLIVYVFGRVVCESPGDVARQDDKCARSIKSP
jgi:hypothetical protein